MFLPSEVWTTTENIPFCVLIAAASDTKIQGYLVWVLTNKTQGKHNSLKIKRDIFPFPVYSLTSIALKKKKKLAPGLPVPRNLGSGWRVGVQREGASGMTSGRKGWGLFKKGHTMCLKCHFNRRGWESRSSWPSQPVPDGSAQPGAHHDHCKSTRVHRHWSTRRVSPSLRSPLPFNNPVWGDHDRMCQQSGSDWHEIGTDIKTDAQTNRSRSQGTVCGGRTTQAPATSPYAPPTGRRRPCAPSARAEPAPVPPQPGKPR